MFNFTVIYVTAEGRQHSVDCHQSYNIAISIAKIQLERGARWARVDVTKVDTPETVQ